VNLLIGSLIESAHGAIYAYGVIAAYAPDSSALDDMAIHRRKRDELIAYAQLNDMKVPAAQPAYELPLPVSDQATASAAAAAIENLMCATWANALSELPGEFTSIHLGFPITCALRAHVYSGRFYAFPGSN
jgi:hypothetical protein